MKLTKPSILELRSLSLVFGGREVTMAGERTVQWSWSDLPVDPAQAHFELRFGSLQVPASGTLPLLVARVGRPIDRVFPVEWLVRPADGQREALDAVTKDLDYYLVAKGEPDPWLYAQHHAGTAANVYSSVHWSFIRMRR